MHKQKIIVGMSGGVDSSVTALLLKQQGYDVEGLFMKNWEDDNSSSDCPATIDVNDAQQVCDKLNIPLHRVNFSNDYWDKVFEYFLAEYKAGRTPNPDILCNKEIKFKAFLDHALTLGADYIATGHYVKKGSIVEQAALLKAEDSNKDQSYFLYALSEQQISRSLFPLGNYLKQDIRKIAADAGFENHAKKDSTGICFIGERKFKTFLQQYLPAQPGEILTTEGKVIGKHEGLMYYTMGQRKGIGIGGLSEMPEEAWYVADKNLATNQLIVAQGTDHPSLFHRQLYVAQLHWINEPAHSGQALMAKTRYRQPDQACTILNIAGNSAEVHFNEPQRAVTPGQSVVFYDKDRCIGGGIIESRHN